MKYPVDQIKRRLNQNLLPQNQNFNAVFWELLQDIDCDATWEESLELQEIFEMYFSAKSSDISPEKIDV